MVDLYVDERVVVWAGRGGAVRFEGGEGLVPQLARCLAETKSQWRWFDRRAVRVWLSGALARPFVVEPVGGLRSIAEAQALAKSAAPGATGLAGPCVVQLESIPIERAAIATAVERRVVDALLSALRQSKLTAHSIRPWWAHALAARRRRRQTQMVCLDDATSVTLLAGDVEPLAMTLAGCDAAQRQAVTRRVCVGQEIGIESVEIGEMDLSQFGCPEAVVWSALGEAAK
jgi:hypothetical protein